MDIGEGDEVPVWLTEWQILEDGHLISVGTDVEWRLSQPEASQARWFREILGPSRPVDLEWDLYRQAETPAWDVRGEVTDMIEVHGRADRHGRPVASRTGFSTVTSTEHAWQQRTRFATADEGEETLMGWVVMLRVRSLQPVSA